VAGVPERSAADEDLRPQARRGDVSRRPATSAAGRDVHAPRSGEDHGRPYADEWLRRRHWAASTSEGVERMLRLHILPELGRWPLAGLRRAHIEQWAAGLSLAPSSVRTLHRTLSSLLASAVEDERIPRNPASGARLPKVDVDDVVPMTPGEVRAVDPGRSARIQISPCDQHLCSTGVHRHPPQSKSMGVRSGVKPLQGAAWTSAPSAGFFVQAIVSPGAGRSRRL
jgi:hypothetical protein